MFEPAYIDYGVDYDYDRSVCTCDNGPCRCTTIINVRINSIDTDSVIACMYRNYTEQHTSRTYSEFDKYCFDRLCRIYKVYDKCNYDIETGPGYYGEEVYGVLFNDEADIYNHFDNILELSTDVDKIKYCLNLEYLDLLDCVRMSTTASIIEISPKDVYVPQEHYYSKICHTERDLYKETELPVAVCVQDGNKYRLIDGYHRFASNKELDTVKIVALSTTAKSANNYVENYWTSTIIFDEGDTKPWLCSNTTSFDTLEQAKNQLEFTRKHHNVLSGWIETFDENNVPHTVFHKCYMGWIINNSSSLE